MERMEKKREALVFQAFALRLLKEILIDFERDDLSWNWKLDLGEISLIDFERDDLSSNLTPDLEVSLAIGALFRAILVR